MTVPSTELTAEPQEVPPAKRSLMPWLTPLALLVLAGAIGVVWLRTTAPPELPPGWADTEQRLSALEARLSRLEQQRPVPAASGPDWTPRVEALERRTSPDLSSLLGRVAGLEQRLLADTEALTARVTALEKTIARDDRLSRLPAAAIALTAGRKLGSIPGAPPALSRFADTNPPTEAALRLRFPAAERAALEAGRPTDDGIPLLNRLLSRAEDLVTIRQGDHVVVGDPAAGVLVRARTALDAGDLSGAVAALSGLQGAAAAAMAGWLADATALRDARAALADMAAQP